MELKTLVMCLADHYAWNEETAKLRELEKVLWELAAEVHDVAEKSESKRIGG